MESQKQAHPGGAWKNLSQNNISERKPDSGVLGPPAGASFGLEILTLFGVWGGRRF